MRECTYLDLKYGTNM